MDKQENQVTFYFGTFGKVIPLLIAVAVIVWAAVSQSNVNGYVAAFLSALIIGILFTKNEKAYGEAIIYGLGKPIFSVIVLAVMLAAVSGKLISGSGAVETIAYYVVAAGFTGRMFVAASFLITCLLAFATGTSVGTYFVVIPILFPVGVMAGGCAGIYDWCDCVWSRLRRQSWSDFRYDNRVVSDAACRFRGGRENKDKIFHPRSSLRIAPIFDFHKDDR